MPGRYSIVGDNDPLRMWVIISVVEAGLTKSGDLGLNDD